MRPLEYLIKKRLVPTKRATGTLIRVKSCNVVVDMLLVCIRSNMKLGLRYKFLILGTYLSDAAYLHEQRCGDWWPFFEQKGVREQRRLGNTDLEAPYLYFYERHAIWSLFRS